MGIVEIKGDDSYMAEALVREIAGRLNGDDGKIWQELFTTHGTKHGVIISKKSITEMAEPETKKATQHGKFQLPEHFCPVPVARMEPDKLCDDTEHEWETEQGDETFEARCVKCGYFYQFEVYE